MAKASAVLLDQDSRLGVLDSSFSDNGDLFDFTPEVFSITTGRSPEIDRILDQIPTPQHLQLYLGMLDVWLKHRSILDEFSLLDKQIQQAATAAEEWQRVTVASITNTYTSNVETRRLSSISKRDSRWIGYRTADQVTKAARLFQIAGFSIEQHDLCDLYGFDLEDLTRLDSNLQIIGFDAFDWRWYPKWQFDLQNGEIYPKALKIIECYHTLGEPDFERIMYWAVRAFLGQPFLTVTQWIAQNLNFQDLVTSITSFTLNKEQRQNPGEFVCAVIDTVIPEIEQSEDKFDQAEYSDEITRLRDSLFAFGNDTNSSRHLLGYIENANRFMNFSANVLMYDEWLQKAGREIASNYIFGYPIYGYLADGLLQNLSEFPGIHPPVDEWLGAATVEKVRTLVNLICVVGPRYDLSEVKNLYGFDDSQLHAMESSNQLISFKGMDYHWYPKWQFDPETKSIRSIASEVIQKIKESNVSLGNYEIAGWVLRENTDGLSYNTPAEWMSDKDRDPVAILHAADELLKAMDV